MMELGELITLPAAKDTMIYGWPIITRRMGLYNIGNNQPVGLLRFIEVLENCLDKKAEKRLLPAQAGDVPVTCADVEDLKQATGFRPTSPIEEGLARFVDWYRSYYRIEVR